ncbi:MAG TPA: hypothetical protein VKB79_05205 [Bryobacteraceae bacterium]|nr:hypothetical protein [Bryobacteraceae bacterium]
MKLTRRELGATAVATVAAATSQAQTPPPPDQGIAQVVRDANRRNAEALAKFEIPIETEPAFQFRA